MPPTNRSKTNHVHRPRHSKRHHHKNKVGKVDSEIRGSKYTKDMREQMWYYVLMKYFHNEMFNGRGNEAAAMGSAQEMFAQYQQNFGQFQPNAMQYPQNIGQYSEPAVQYQMNNAQYPSYAGQFQQGVEQFNQGAAPFSPNQRQFLQNPMQPYPFSIDSSAPKFGVSKGANQKVSKLTVTKPTSLKSSKSTTSDMPDFMKAINAIGSSASQSSHSSSSSSSIKDVSASGEQPKKARKTSSSGKKTPTFAEVLRDTLDRARPRDEGPTSMMQMFSHAFPGMDMKNMPQKASSALAAIGKVAGGTVIEGNSASSSLNSSSSSSATSTTVDRRTQRHEELLKKLADAKQKIMDETAAKTKNHPETSDEEDNDGEQSKPYDEFLRNNKEPSWSAIVQMMKNFSVMKNAVSSGKKPPFQLNQ